MGVTTSFFSATIDQLKAAAPGWIEPQYGDVLVDVFNPFTRRVSHRQHQLLSDHPSDCPRDEIHLLIKKERAFAWKHEVELDSLMKLMTNAPEARIAELRQYALLGPEPEESWVFVVPDLFVDALAAVQASESAALAKDWQRKLGWDFPPTALLGELVEVAREARAAGHRMFSYVTL